MRSALSGERISLSKTGQGVSGALSVLFFVFTLGLAVFGGERAALAQSANDLQARLNRVENEVQTLSRALFRGEQPPADFAASAVLPHAGQADLDVRLSQIENDIRTLTGKVEEQSFTIGQMQTRLDKALSDADMRLRALETSSRIGVPSVPGGMGAVTGGLAPQQGGAPYPPGPFASSSPTAGSLGTLTQGGVPIPGGAIPPVLAGGGSGDDPAGVYGRAFAILQGGDYGGAAQAFEAFLAQYPQDPLAPNAQYWLGESYYARQDYAQAARVFAEAYRKYPKSSKTPDNLLKLALSLAGQGQKDDACVALGQLRSEYPDGAGPVLARAGEESKKLGCP